MSIIGKDVWWNTKLQEFKKKRYNLIKVPLKFRCPSCGKIVVKPEDRKPLRVLDEKDMAIKRKKVHHFLDTEKPTKEEYDAFLDSHEELSIPIIHLVERTPSHSLAFYGGVCQDCWLDGFGDFGAYGGFVGRQIKPDAEKMRLSIQKHEKEKLEKYGKEPKYWLVPGFTKNPEYQKWRQRQIEIDRNEKRKKNAVFVESHIIKTE